MVTHESIASDIAVLIEKVDRLTERMEEMREMQTTYDAVKTGSRFVTGLAKFLAGMFMLGAAIKLGAAWVIEAGGKP